MFVMSRHKDFKFGTQVGIWTTNCSWKGCDYLVWHILILWAPSISQKYLRLELSNFVHN